MQDVMERYGLIIGGEKMSTAEYLEIRDPGNGELVGECPVATSDDLDRAVKAAREAYKSWSQSTDDERKAAVNRIADKVHEHMEELAELLTREQGKPLNGMGSRFELHGAEAWARHTGTLELPVEVLSDDESGRVELHRKPLGVVGSITPWNFPMLIAIWHFVPAIRTGNTVVIKPSPHTPLSTIRLVEILNEVLPAGRPECGRRARRSRADDDRASGHPEDRLHRLVRHRQKGDAGRVRQSEAGDAGTRRQ